MNSKLAGLIPVRAQLAASAATTTTTTTITMSVAQKALASLSHERGAVLFEWAPFGSHVRVSATTTTTSPLRATTFAWSILSTGFQANDKEQRNGHFVSKQTCCALSRFGGSLKWHFFSRTKSPLSFNANSNRFPATCCSTVLLQHSSSKHDAHSFPLFRRPDRSLTSN